MCIYFCLNSHEHTDTPEGSQDIIVTMGSFKSRTIRVKVSFDVDVLVI